jgi:hypothetical protein
LNKRFITESQVYIHLSDGLIKNAIGIHTPGAEKKSNNMEFLGVSNIISMIEKIGVLQTIFVTIVMTCIYLLSRHWLKRIDSNYEKIKKDNEILQDKITALKTEHEDKMSSIEAEIKKKLDQRTNFMKNHPFFSTMDYLVDVKIPGIYYRSQFKKIVFTDILVNMVSSANEVFKNFVFDSKNYETGAIEFRNNITTSMKNMHQSFAAACNKDAVPAIVMESFSAWVAPLTRFVFSATESICDSKMYETNIDKINTILSINLAVYDEMVSNIEVYLDEINGDFNGLTYKGIVCEEEHHHHP